MYKAVVPEQSPVERWLTFMLAHIGIYLWFQLLQSISFNTNLCSETL